MACCLPVADLAVRISGCPAARRPPQRRGGRGPRPAGHAARPATAPVRGEGTIAAIKVEGNQRIETGTILSYMLVQPGDPFDPDRLDRSLKTLYATGLFQDVRINRDGDTLVVRLVENPLVNRVAFEGNHKLTDDQLRPEMQLKPRAVFTPALAEQDRQHILDLYAKRGYYNARVDPQVIRLDQNRVDVVFQINDGSVTLISKIIFVGNHEFSEDRLTEVINSREERWWRFLSSSDEYDPQRLNFDKELLRRFYLKNGYVDFEVRAAKSELAPDRSGFFLTFNINEGERYRVGKITINSQLRNLTGDDLRPDLEISEGDWYDGDAVGRSVDAMELDIHNRSYAFVEVKPRIDRDREKHIVDLAFDVGEGPRVYVERIDIVGNTRTKDKVIRREFRLAEGDALNAEAVRRSRERLRNLNYFNDVKIAPSPGSVPDKAVLTTTIDEKATGELTLGGGYSTDAGALLDIGLSERNLVGSGVSAGINGVLAQRRSSITASITDPYFLDRNLVVGGDVFLIQTNFLGTEPYDEKRVGFDVRAGYDFNEYLRQVWSYSLVGRTVYNVAPNASFFITQLAGYTVLSQVSQSLSLDHRDSKTDPHTGYLVTLGHRLRRSRRQCTLRPHQHQRPVFHSARPFHREQRLGYRADGGHRLPVQRGAAGADHRPLLPGWRQPSRLPDRRCRPARRCHGRSAWRAVHLDPIDRAALPVADLGRHRAVGPRLRRYRRPDPGEFREAARVCASRTGSRASSLLPRHRVSASVSGSPGTLSSVC